MSRIIGQKYDIWRTYNTRKSNISEGARLIENYLYKSKSSISKRTGNDAKLLTDFFRELKKLSLEQGKKDELEKEISTKLFGSYVKNLPLLDFTLGGNAASMITEKGDSGGIAFEKEIEKLIENNNSNSQKIVGTSSATAYINLGVKNRESAIKFVTESIDEEIISEIDNIEKNIVEIIDEKKVPHFFLKVGAKRSGKIDIDSGSNSSVVFTVEGEASKKLKKIKELLETSSFSIKSYLTEGEVHLGDTNPQKAVSAVAEYVASKRSGKQHIRSTAIYYVHHPIEGSDRRIEPEQSERVSELYAAYGRMKKIYELTGIGLKYDDISEFRNVDFLLVNRAFEGGDITIYSTQDLVNRFGLNDYYKFDIQ